MYKSETINFDVSSFCYRLNCLKTDSFCTVHLKSKAHKLDTILNTRPNNSFWYWRSFRASLTLFHEYLMYILS